jgi:antitoxin (DNA-binding transcriptional repressor) of toxin-antitoxin stability system
MCVMRTVTVREAQHNLANILKLVEAGETIEILRRKTRVARLTPIVEDAATVPDWGDHTRRLASLWGNTCVVALDETLDDLRSGL